MTTIEPRQPNETTRSKGAIQLKNAPIDINNELLQTLRNDDFIPFGSRNSRFEIAQGPTIDELETAFRQPPSQTTDLLEELREGTDKGVKNKDLLDELRTVQNEAIKKNENGELLDELRTVQNKAISENENSGLLDELREGGDFAPINNRMGKLSASRNADGSFTRGQFKLYWQPDNSVFVEKTDKSPAGTVLPNGNIERSITSPMPWTYAIAKLKLVPGQDGKFYRAGSRNSGEYSLQADKSIWYSGGQIEGKSIAAGTFVEGEYDKNRNTPFSNTSTLGSMRATPFSDGTWGYYGNDKKSVGDSMVPLSTGNILSISSTTSGKIVYIFTAGKWLNIGTIDEIKEKHKTKPDLQEIVDGIDKIFKSRELRGWKPATN